jgi:hypothetical protein
MGYEKRKEMGQKPEPKMSMSKMAPAKKMMDAKKTMTAKKTMYKKKM